MKDCNIFITGATGFIGKKLLVKLVQNNLVSALVRPESKNKINDFPEKKVQVIFGNLLDNASYSGLLDKADYVFHLAGLFKVEASKEDLFKNNVLGTKKLLEACVGKKNIKKIIYFSTAYVVGIKEGNFIKEDESYPNKFKNWYEWSKSKAEQTVLDFYKKHKLPIIVVRPVIVYGPNNSYGFYHVLNLIAKGKLWVFPGKKENKIHLVHIEDVVNATVELADLKNNIGEIYHICDDHPNSCREIIETVCQCLNVKPPLVNLPRYVLKFISRLPIWRLTFKEISPESLDYFLYNQSFLNKKLKSCGYLFSYPTPLEGLRLTIDWYSKNNLLPKTNRDVSI
ncbi:MAG: hypothetical protein A2166_06185 [Omnitrophica WOR_2 bacterium RBG_13_41_10]|nr:MAG: hypothetical protein A2166_06185 [Omnitrophica WOR_2 bacterium RBG_13_41_10]